MNFITEHWDQLIFIGLLIVWATRSREQISSLIKDTEILQNSMDIITTQNNHQQETLVKLRAEQDVTNKQITALWDFVNKIKDKVG
tara:strand:- start:389 stop:646 length:258 start_codon:yes stop_codon:yes gene_type:complete